MDLSDGLADALRQVAARQRVGVRVDAEATADRSRARGNGGRRAATIPSSAAVAGRRRLRAVVRGAPSAAVGGCGTSAARRRSAADKDRRVHERSGSSCWTRDGEEDAAYPRGFEHFGVSRIRMQIAESFIWRSARDVVVAMVFVFLYETTTRLPLRGQPGDDYRSHRLAPGRRALAFSATAYCKGETTASGVGVRTGIAAADPGDPAGRQRGAGRDANSRYSGIWTVMDTGPAVRGRRSTSICGAARRRWSSGGDKVRLTVLRLGWNPENSIPGMVDRSSGSARPTPRRPMLCPRQTVR